MQDIHCSRLHGCIADLSGRCLSYIFQGSSLVAFPIGPTNHLNTYPLLSAFISFVIHKIPGNFIGGVIQDLQSRNQGAPRFSGFSCCLMARKPKN